MRARRFKSTLPRLVGLGTQLTTLPTDFFSDSRVEEVVQGSRSVRLRLAASWLEISRLAAAEPDVRGSLFSGLGVQMALSNRDRVGEGTWSYWLEPFGPYIDRRMTKRSPNGGQLEGHVCRREH